jgi:shikimate kinase
MKIFITGLPGVGKTHFGASLSNYLDIPFFDLDDYMEDQNGSSISKLIQKHGQDGFRKIEKEALTSLVSKLESKTSYVISLGGGTICFEGNLDLVKKHGVLVYLQDGLDAIAKRIIENVEVDRPLIVGRDLIEIKENLSKLIVERRDFYEQSHIIIGVSASNDLHLFTKRLELFTG